MVWQEIYFNKILNKEELNEAVSRAFTIEKKDVMILSDLSELDNYNVEYKVLCLTYLLPEEEEFRLRVDISCNDDLEPENDMIVYSKFIETLNCKIMVDNYSIIPSTMLVIESTLVDYDNLSEAKEYELE